MLKLSFQYFNLCPLPLGLWLGTTEESFTPSSLLAPVTWIRSAPWTMPALSPSIHQVFHDRNHLCGPLMKLLHYVPVSLAMGSLGLNPALQECLSLGPSRGEGSPSLDLLVTLYLMEPRRCVSCLCHKAMLLPRGQLGIHQNLQALFCEAAFQLDSPQNITVGGLNASHVQDDVLPFAELHEIPVCPFLQPVKVPLDGAQPPAASATATACHQQTCWGCTVPLSRSLKMLNSIGHSIRDWGTPLATGLQLELVPLITTLYSPAQFHQTAWYHHSVLCCLPGGRLQNST